MRSGMLSSSQPPDPDKPGAGRVSTRQICLIRCNFMILCSLNFAQGLFIFYALFSVDRKNYISPT